MTKYLLIFIAAFFLYFAAGAQPVPSYNADRLVKRTQNADTVYVVNFWATWCAPCVQELPEFDSLQAYYRNKPVKILLVSLDFKEEYQQKIPAFIAKKHPQPDILWFSETDANSFIPKIDDRWTGSIPATWIVDSGNKFKTLLEKTITARELRSVIDPLLAVRNAQKSIR